MENIHYVNTTATTFTGLTVGAAHAAGAEVKWFITPDEWIRATFAHEAGHLMNLQHRPNYWVAGGWHNVMNASPTGGATLGNGCWPVFRDAARGEDALQGQFRVTL